MSFERVAVENFAKTFSTSIGTPIVVSLSQEANNNAHQSCPVLHLEDRYAPCQTNSLQKRIIFYSLR